MTLDDLLALRGEEFIRGAYQALLGRPADEGGLRHYLARMRKGHTKASVLLDLSHSAEARRSEGDAALAALPPEAFVDAMHMRVLGRQPDPNEKRRSLELLRAGTARNELLRRLEQSDAALAARNEDASFRADLDALLASERKSRAWWRKLDPTAPWKRALQRMEDQLREVSADVRACREQLEGADPSTRGAGGAGARTRGARDALAGAGDEQRLSPYGRRIHQRIEAALARRDGSAE